MPADLGTIVEGEFISTSPECRGFPLLRATYATESESTYTTTLHKIRTRKLSS
jgi:hypothetical protein